MVPRAYMKIDAFSPCWNMAWNSVSPMRRATARVEAKAPPTRLAIAVVSRPCTSPSVAIIWPLFSTSMAASASTSLTRSASKCWILEIPSSVTTKFVKMRLSWDTVHLWLVKGRADPLESYPPLSLG
ncbi:hypothetical protein D3C86_1491520 [compost metagenome]